MIIKTPCEELNRVLEGGIRTGGVTMIHGAIGVGKTYVLRTIANKMCAEGIDPVVIEKYFPRRGYQFYTNEARKTLRFRFRMTSEGNEALRFIGVPVRSYLIDDFSQAPYSIEKITSIAMRHDVAMVVTCTKPVIETLYSCDIVLELRGRLDGSLIGLQVIKNRFGISGATMGYAVSCLDKGDNLIFQSFMHRSGVSGECDQKMDLDKMVLKMDLDKMVFEGLSEKDHTGEVYNPYTGEWGYL